jgi:outer membrane lipoprotein-sorting protein
MGRSNHEPAAGFSRSRRLLTQATLMATAVPGVAFAAPSAQDLLDGVDEIRCPGRPFAVRLTMTEFEGGKQVDNSILQVWSRPSEVPGAQYMTLVSFIEPARDAGKLLLRSGNDLWFFDPLTKASIRIAPQQRLLGQAANGDVVTIMLAREYAPAIKGEEEITDGERKVRRTIRLALTARSPAATYATIDLWVDAEKGWPLRARFHSESGHLLKTVFYRRYQQQLGRERPMETVIIDGLNPQAVTLMRFGDFSAPNVPRNWFNREHLPRFQPE